MLEDKTTVGFDFGALREAIERRDPNALLGFYAEDAQLRVENAALPGGPAFELKGKAHLERYLQAVCDQEMHRAVVGEPVFGEGSISFVEVCEYPRGVGISVSTTLEVATGLIGRQTDVVEYTRSDGTEGGER